MVADYVGQTNDLTTLVSSTRQKRGLIDVGGHVLKFLFGTATDSDLELTNSRINEIENLSDDLSHNTKDQITVLGNMQSEISNHSRAINKIISTIKEYHEVMHITMARNYIRELIYANQLRTLFQYLKLNSALSEVKDAINLAVQRMARLHLAIEDLAAGKMTSNLLPPHQFLKVLTSVENSPVLIRTPTRWLYATSKETRVILNCFGRDANQNVSAITLKGEGEIPKQDRCDLIADGHRVPARFIGSSSYSSEFGKIVFPEVDGMYSSEEHSLLVHDVNETLKVLQGLDDQLGTLSVKEYSLDCTVQVLSGTSLVVVLTVVVLLLRWRVRVADLLRAALGDSTQHPQAAQTESPLQTLEEAVRTVPRPDADQGEIDRDQSGRVESWALDTLSKCEISYKLTTSSGCVYVYYLKKNTGDQPVSRLNECFWILSRRDMVEELLVLMATEGQSCVRRTPRLLCKPDEQLHLVLSLQLLNFLFYCIFYKGPARVTFKIRGDRGNRPQVKSHEAYPRMRE
ncbi:hypothetical protein J6590_055655 [Homalodisca vitripennis]|nr:hypothetical protein J6590_055655 [Homalodisca vitripennis]